VLRDGAFREINNSEMVVGDIYQPQDESSWVYEGSKLETMKAQTLAVAINIGYSSQRGKIIRKILTKVIT